MENNNIFKSGVRIFRPSDITAIIKAITKIDYRDKFEVMLYTGARYNELRWLFTHQAAFNGESILMPSFKPKAVHKERYIRLNSNGKRAVSYFLRSKRNLPARDGWNQNLIRWCEKAGVSKEGVSSKTTRKTWESWLITRYPDNATQIFLSQGHTDKVSLDFYLMLNFDEQDKQDMKFYTDGWI